MIEQVIQSAALSARAAQDALETPVRPLTPKLLQTALNALTQAAGLVRNALTHSDPVQHLYQANPGDWGACHCEHAFCAGHGQSVASELLTVTDLAQRRVRDHVGLCSTCARALVPPSLKTIS